MRGGGGMLCGMGWRRGLGGLQEKGSSLQDWRPRALAVQDGQVSWSFPSKQPLVNVSVGCLLCPRDELLR